MIFIALLFAPTVPSEPNPQNLQLVVPSGIVSTSSPTGSDVKVTSSIIPIVKWSFGSSALRLSNTAMICAGVVSFEPRP